MSLKGSEYRLGEVWWSALFWKQLRLFVVASCGMHFSTFWSFHQHLCGEIKQCQHTRNSFISFCRIYISDLWNTIVREIYFWQLTKINTNKQVEKHLTFHLHSLNAKMAAVQMEATFQLLRWWPFRSLSAYTVWVSLRLGFPGQRLILSQMTSWP